MQQLMTLFLAYSTIIVTAHLIERILSFTAFTSLKETDAVLLAFLLLLSNLLPASRAVLAHLALVPGLETQGASLQTQCQQVNVSLPQTVAVMTLWHKCTWGGNWRHCTSQKALYQRMQGKKKKAMISLSQYVAIITFQKNNRWLHPTGGFDLWLLLFFSWFCEYQDCWPSAWGQVFPYLVLPG